MTDYNYLNYTAGYGSKYCVQFPYLLRSSSLGNGVEEHSRTLTLHMGQWRGPSSGWPTKIYHHSLNIFLYKSSFYLSSSSFFSAYSMSDLISSWSSCDWFNLWWIAPQLKHVADVLQHRLTETLEKYAVTKWALRTSPSSVQPHEFLTSYSRRTILSSSLTLCISVASRLWEIQVQVHHQWIFNSLPKPLHSETTSSVD